MASPSCSGSSLNPRRSPRVAAALAVVRPATVSHFHVCVRRASCTCGFAGCPRRPPRAPAHQRMRPKNAPRMQAQNATVRPFPFFAEVPHGNTMQHLRKKREGSHRGVLCMHASNVSGAHALVRGGGRRASRAACKPTSCNCAVHTNVGM